MVLCRKSGRIFICPKTEKLASHKAPRAFSSVFRVTLLFLKIFGWLIAHTPEFLLHFTAWLLGPVVLLLPKRRQIVFSNLHHAFPKRARAWHRKIALKSSRRLIETGMLSLASPFMSDARLRRVARATPSFDAALARRIAENPESPGVIGTLHLAYWESLTWLALFTEYRGEVGVVFRPLKNDDLNTWIKSTRERHGLKLFSRRDGLFEIFRVMKRRGVISILFDQNAGHHGALTTFLGRVCSTTEFPGTLVEKYNARLTIIYPRRYGFWRIGYECVDIVTGGGAIDATIALNRWLENALSNDDNMCASWLWSHGRWRSQNWPTLRFRFHTKNDYLDADLAAHGFTRATMPRKTRVWVRFPADKIAPAQLAAALPIFRDLRRSRPDTQLTLLAPADALDALKPLIDDGTADYLRELPRGALASRCYFKKLRLEYPDVFVNLDESARADREAKSTRSPQRFGLVRPGRRRPRLTDVYEAPADFLATNPAPSALWRKLFEHFGLPEEGKAESLKD
ncbi:heptosyltransferase-2 [Ereboglobus sp. PH5-5]|nr:heptosyltransferase-2 [Ereboglobus sp. PH5-5]